MRGACAHCGGPRVRRALPASGMMRPMPPPTRIEQFAAWVSGLSIDAIPERVRERARLQAMNTVAAGLAGSTSPAVTRLREATSYWAAPGAVGVIGSDEEWEPA